MEEAFGVRREARRSFALRTVEIGIPVVLGRRTDTGAISSKSMRLPMAFGHALIGATALETGWTLATANLRHYRTIARLELFASRS